MDEKAYKPIKQSREIHCLVAGLGYMVRAWGPETSPPLVLLHGIRDTSATFQFLVDALQYDWRILAPDWRGHGLTSGKGHPWFHDYLGDLHELLEVLLPGSPVRLVGHSLGGNVASVYAGLRPEKVSHMVSLDGFGMLGPSAPAFAGSLAKWLRDGETEPAIKRYSSVDQMALKLREANRRLSLAKARFLAGNLSRQLPDGAWTWQFSGSMRRSMPTFHSLKEWVACWQGITADKLWIAAADPLPGTVRSNPEASAFMCEHIGSAFLKFLPDTGHNLHHDAPAELARMLEGFLAGTR